MTPSFFIGQNLTLADRTQVIVSAIINNNTLEVNEVKRGTIFDTYEVDITLDVIGERPSVEIQGGMSNRAFEAFIADTKSAQLRDWHEEQATEAGMLHGCDTANEMRVRFAMERAASY